MEPKQPSPNFLASNERPSSFNNGEQAPSILNPEQSVEHNSPERRDPAVVEVDRQVQQALPSLPTPIPVTQSPQDDASAAKSGQVPLVANDDDLIEKEWVDHAKRIIAVTKDDPYRREKEISKLQVDYIQKRYGRKIGESTD